MFDLSSNKDYVIEANCEDVLRHLAAESFKTIYIDPPFNTGKRQQRITLKTERVAELADRIGFQGQGYLSTEMGRMDYTDIFDDYLSFIAPKLEQARRLLTDDGTLYFHIDSREAHYCKVLLDQIFGRSCFLNEIIWAYDYGGRARDRWPQKHDTILVYVKNMKSHYFNQDHIERIPYMAPGLVSVEKRERGKLPTDVWWHTIVPTSGHEKTGYPSQKPEGILTRVLLPTTDPGDRVLDFFGGSGTTGAVAQKLDRRFVMIDANPQAVTVMRDRLGTHHVDYYRFDGTSFSKSD